MFLTVFDRKANKKLGVAYLCHGCGLRSPVRKVEKLPPRWEQRTELHFNNVGECRRGAGFVVNYYCPACVSCGVTARTVAGTSGKFRRGETGKAKSPG